MGDCKNQCEKYQHKHRGSNTAYDEGYKFCKACDLYLYLPGVFRCPCCSNKLRTKGRKAISRERHRQMIYALAR